MATYRLYAVLHSKIGLLPKANGALAYG
jgi:hypothetical protein